MKMEILSKPLESAECDVLAVFAFERKNGEGAQTKAAARIDAATGGWVSDVYASGEFTGKPFEVAVYHRPGGVNARRVALIGAGKAAHFDANVARKATACAVRHFRTRANSLWIAVENSEHASTMAEGAAVADWEQDARKSAGNRVESKISSCALLIEGGVTPEIEAAAERGRIVGESQNFSRDLINDPGNLLPPRELVRRGREMAESLGLAVDVLDRDRMKQLGMGSLLGVAIGSAEPPFLMTVSYKPANPSSNDHLALIGKGVTFDTGGVSIKPAEGMEKMKNDMGGAGAMLGAMRAIALLKPGVAVTAYIPTVENMVGDKAQRPGDIVTSLAGKTIEVLNTDAEGRLILIDAITYAKREGCTHIVDAATLTGAIGVALGDLHAGAFTNDDALLGKVMTAAKQAGEPLWHMPVDDDYREMLKSPYADIANISGGRLGGACTAAAFLREWVEDTPWVHLDIAMTAYLNDPKPHLAKGATGFGVRTFVNLALHW